VLEVLYHHLYHHAKFGEAQISPAAGAAENVEFFTGSIARSASRRYLVYSEADFEVFRPAGATRCTVHGAPMKVKFGTEEGTQGLLVHAKFHPYRCNDKGVGPPKLKFLLRFDQNVEHKRPAGRISCAIFTKFAEFVPHFRMR